MREMPDVETNQNLNEKVEFQNDEAEKITEKEKTEKVKESRSRSSHHKKHKKEKKKKSSKDRKDEKRREQENDKVKAPDSKSTKESKRPSLTMINLFGVPETKPKSKPKKSKLKESNGDKGKTETKIRDLSLDNEPESMGKVCQSSLVLMILFRKMYFFHFRNPNHQKEFDLMKTSRSSVMEILQ